MLASLVSMRNLAIVAFLAVSALGLNLMQLKHLWKVEAENRAAYNLLAQTNVDNDKVAQDLSNKLAACVGKETANDLIAQTALVDRDTAQAKLADALKRTQIKWVKIYETPDCKKFANTPVCPAVSDGLRIGRPAPG
jgi:hypothetical protein